MLAFVPLILAAFFVGEVAIAVNAWFAVSAFCVFVALYFCGIGVGAGEGVRSGATLRAIFGPRRSVAIGVACCMIVFGVGAWQARREMITQARCNAVFEALEGRSVVAEGVFDESRSMTQWDIIGRVRVASLTSLSDKISLSLPPDISCVMGVRLPFGMEISSLSVRLTGSVRRSWLTVRRFDVIDGGDDSLLFAMRRFFVDRFLRLFPGSTGGFMIGILAGGVSYIGPDVVADFRQTGLTHIVAVSGYNVSLVLQLLMPLALWVPRRFRGWALLLPLGFFTAFSGFSASAVRAAVMGGMGVVGSSFGRPNSTFFGVLWSAAIMTFFSPLIFLQDRGFQLSFLATIAVLYVSPFLEVRVISFFGKNFSGQKKTVLPTAFTGFLKVFLPTFSVYLLTLPVMAVFGRLPLIGLVTNLLFVAAVPWFMLAGAVIFLVSCVFFPFAQFLAFLAAFLLRGYFFLVHFFAKIPYGIISLSSWSPWVVLAYYGAIFFFIIRLRIKSARINK